MASSEHRSPPRAAVWLARHSAAASLYDDSILGDLHEGWTARAARSLSEAQWWYWRQAIAIALSFVPSQLARLRSIRPRAKRNRRLAQDLRYAIRGLVRKPGFSLVMLAVLAIGVGANTTIFGVVRNVLLKPLSFPEPNRAVALWSTNQLRGETRNGVSRQDAEDWVRQSHSFETIGTYVPVEANVVVGGEPQRIKVAFASHGVFRALGVHPALGRTTTDADDRAFARVAVVSNGFWASALDSDPNAIGRTIDLNGEPLQIVGVMPPGFDFPDAATAVLRPFAAAADQTGPRIARWVAAVGRLRPGVSLAQARSDMNTISDRLAREYPASNRDVGVLVEPLLSSETANVRAPLLVAWGMAVLVLMIVTITTANLFLARTAEREPEVALRVALGADSRVLARASLLESLLLALTGGALGTAVAAAVAPLVRRLALLQLRRVEGLAIDGWVLGYSMLSILIVGLAFGVIPAIRAAGVAPGSVLHGNTRTTSGQSSERVRGGLVAAQVAFAALVLVGAVLLFRSFDRLSRVQPGFAVEDRITFRVAPSLAVMGSRDEAAAFYSELTARLSSLPGAQAVTGVNRLPLTGSWWTTDFRPEGQQYETGREPTASYRVVLPNYLAAMGIPLLRGRALDASDEHGDANPVVVSAAFAARGWPGRDPIGQRVTFDPATPGARWYTVVGVAGNVHPGLASPVEPVVYVPLSRAQFGHFGDWGMDVVLHGRLPEAQTIAASRRIMRALASSVPIFSTRPLTSLVTDDLARQRALVILMGAFATIAAILSALGVYGVIAYGVTQRRAELGVRMALGAGARAVVRTVVLRGLALCAVGGSTGLLAAALASRLLSRLLYGVGPLDAPTFALVGTALVCLAVIASGIPAFRASRVDPIEAMRKS